MGRLLNTRLQSILNELFVVFATLLLGNAIHMAFVANTAAPTSPAVVLQVLFGAGFGFAGFKLRLSRTDRSETAATTTDEDETEIEDADFDPELSPLSADSFDNMERDDSR